MKLKTVTLGLLAAGCIGFIGCDSDSVSVHGSYHEDRHIYRHDYDRPRPIDEADSSVSVRVDDRDAPRSRYDDDDSAPPPQYDSGDRVSADPVDEPVDQSDSTYFQDDLQPYGDWVVTADFGRCWRPHGIAVGWRPYTVGHWVYTDQGWLWASDEPYGWAVYHYGRWYEDGRYGWVWVPGRTWAPAWVAWRHGGGCAGWAPLPPVQSGVSVSLAITIGHIHPDHYCFVDERYIDAPHVYEHARPVQQNVTIINNTTNITNITTVNNKVVNKGVDVAEVEKVSGHKVQKVAVVQTSTKGSTKQTGNEVAVFKKDLPPKKKAPVVDAKKPTDDRGTRYSKNTDPRNTDRGTAQTFGVQDKNTTDSSKGKKVVHEEVDDSPKKPAPPKTGKPTNDDPHKHVEPSKNDDPKSKGKGGDDGKTDKNYRASDDPRDVHKPSNDPKGKKTDNGDDKGKKKGNDKDKDTDTDQNVR